MKLFGYSAESEKGNATGLAEVTLVACSAELLVIASFLLAAAEGMEKRDLDWEHEHLSDKHKEFQDSPHLVVFNPEAGSR